MDPDGRSFDEDNETDDKQKKAETAVSATGTGVQVFSEATAESGRQAAAQMGQEAVDSSSKVLGAIDNFGKVAGAAGTVATAGMQVADGLSDDGTLDLSEQGDIAAGIGGGTLAGLAFQLLTKSNPYGAAASLVGGAVVTAYGDEIYEAGGKVVEGAQGVYGRYQELRRMVRN